MGKKLVTCPDTGHLEEIELDATSDGVLIAGCSRFPSGCQPSCTRECARRMDRRDRLERRLADAERVLVLAIRHGDIPALAEELAGALRADQLAVDIVVPGEQRLPLAESYDAIVIGCSRQFGSAVRAVVEFLRVHAAALAHMPTFFFGDAGLERMTADTGWQPTSALIASRVSPETLLRFAARVAEDVPDRR